MMDGNTLRFLIFISVFVLMLILEAFSSRHPTVDSKPRRLGIHLGLSGLNTLLLMFVFGAAAVGAAEIAQSKDWGLLNFLNLMLYHIILIHSQKIITGRFRDWDTNESQAAGTKFRLVNIVLRTDAKTKFRSNKQTMFDLGITAETK